MESLRLKPHAYQGKLITFCGLDGCGKTTQIQKLREVLIQRGYDVALTKQPTDAVRRSQIFRTYMDCENHDGYEYLSLSLLAASDRVQHSTQVIEPLLAQRKIVISDRYFYSCLANLHARGYENAQWITEISAYIVRPDIAFFLDVDVDTAIARVRTRHEEANRYIDIALQHKLRKEYLEIARENDGIVIPTAIATEETFKQLCTTIDTLF
jgi:dTMP kinase